jgi:hypothetical protein
MREVGRLIPEWLSTEGQFVLFVFTVLLFVILTLLLCALLILWFPLALYWSRKRRKKAFIQLPNLGIWTGKNADLESALQQLVDHLDQSINPTFQEQLAHCLKANKKMRRKEFEKRWFEWKRFLILATLIPSIQMYSKEVDEIWHQMLAFTKEYDDFSQRFFGFRFAHHPNSPGHKVKPGEREWFTFLYTLLFKKTNWSVYTWKLGYKQALSYEKLDDFRWLSVDELAKKHFYPLAQQRNPLVKKLTKEVIWQIQYFIQQIEHHVEQHGKSTDPHWKQDGDWHTLKGHEKVSATVRNVLFITLYHPEEFAKHSDWFPEVTINRALKNSQPDADSDCSSCGGDGGSCGGGCGGGE